MRNTYLTIFFLLLFTTSGLSQVEESNNLTLQLGVISSYFVKSNTTTYRTPTSFSESYSIGLTYEFESNKNKLFEAGLSFQRKGWREQGNILDTVQFRVIEAERTFIFDYLVIDIQHKIPVAFLDLYLGPYLGFKINAKTKTYLRNTIGDVQTLIDPRLSPFIDFGVMGGLGYDFLLKNTHNIGMRINYSLGINDLFKGKGFFQDGFRHSSLHFLLSYSFPVK